MAAPDWVSYTALGVSLASFFTTTGLAVANRWRGRQERQQDIAPYLEGNLSSRPAVPDQGLPQSYVIDVLNTGPSDARNVGFLVDLHGFPVSGFWPLLKAGYRARAEPRLTRPEGARSGVVVGIVFADDRAGRTWARPWKPQPNRMMRRRGIQPRRPQTVNEMFEKLNGRPAPEFRTGVTDPGIHLYPPEEIT